MGWFSPPSLPAINAATTCCHLHLIHLLHGVAANLKIYEYGYCQAALRPAETNAGELQWLVMLRIVICDEM